MDDLAKWLGYVTMIAAGLAFIAVCLTLALNLLWRKFQDAYGLADLINGYRAHKRHENARGSIVDKEGTS